ncbi:MAG: hypothetical protein V4551_08165 [Pseudomonadota bacterium]
MEFIGAEAAFFCGASVLTCLWDEKPGLRWPGLWDLTGGGREGDESPETGCIGVDPLADVPALCRETEVVRGAAKGRAPGGGKAAKAQAKRLQHCVLIGEERLVPTDRGECDFGLDAQRVGKLPTATPEGRQFAPLNVDLQKVDPGKVINVVQPCGLRDLASGHLGQGRDGMDASGHPRVGGQGRGKAGVPSQVQGREFAIANHVG